MQSRLLSITRRLLVGSAAAFAVCLTAALPALSMGSAHAGPAHAAATAENGRYVGSSGVWSVDFQVSGRTISGLRTDLQATECGPVSENVVTTHFPGSEIEHGKFTSATTAGAGSSIPQHYEIRGDFSSPTAVKGTIEVHFVFPHNALPACNLSAPFTAKHAGR